jgi:hypothetical protein
MKRLYGVHSLPMRVTRSPILFVHPNNIRRRVHIRKHLIMQLFPHSSISVSYFYLSPNISLGILFPTAARQAFQTNYETQTVWKKKPRTVVGEING